MDQNNQFTFDEHHLLNLLKEKLVKALGNVAGEARAIMFSGGFDAILLALLTQQQGAHVQAMTIQFEDFNSFT